MQPRASALATLSRSYAGMVIYDVAADPATPNPPAKARSSRAVREAAQAKARVRFMP
jgi:hypothetical protein